MRKKEFSILLLYILFFSSGLVVRSQAFFLGGDGVSEVLKDMARVPLGRVLNLQPYYGEPCDLTSAVIVDNCAGGASPLCEPGEIVDMFGSYTGDCSAADFFQINAMSSDSICDVRYSGGDMSGIWDPSISLGGESVSGAWTIPVITADCSGKTVSATLAELYDGGAPGIGILVDSTSSVSGDLVFVLGDEGEFTFNMYKGWNLLSTPYESITTIIEDTCGATSGEFYYYDVVTNTWRIDTIGINNLQKGIGYWFYAINPCYARIYGSGPISSNDITIYPGWNQVGSPTLGLTDASSISNRCTSCSGGSCNDITVLWYNPITKRWVDASILEPGKGYVVRCID